MKKLLNYLKENCPKFLQSKKRKFQEKIKLGRQKEQQLEQEKIIKRKKEREEIQKEEILHEYRLIKEKKSKLNRKERNNFILKLHKLVKKGIIKVEE